MTTEKSIANVTVSPETEVSIPVPPVNVSVSVPNTTPSSVDLSQQQYLM